MFSWNRHNSVIHPRLNQLGLHRGPSVGLEVKLFDDLSLFTADEEDPRNYFNLNFNANRINVQQC